MVEVEISNDDDRGRWQWLPNGKGGSCNGGGGGNDNGGMLLEVVVLLWRWWLWQTGSDGDIGGSGR